MLQVIDDEVPAGVRPLKLESVKAVPVEFLVRGKQQAGSSTGKQQDGKTVLKQAGSSTGKHQDKKTVRKQAQPEMIDL